MSASTAANERVRARLADVAGGPELLGVAGGRDDLFLVGGAVRDLLLGGTPHELDVVVEGDLAEAAAAVADRLAGRLTVHERFGTASVEAAPARVDLARARTERYPEPGSLPVVVPASLAEDLARRDFTVNAIAVPLHAGDEPAPHAVPHALEDLDAGRLRVLHDASFVDDPTRLLRLARYAARLGFAVEEHTAELVAAAVRASALATVSDARIGAELRLLLAERDPIAAVEALGRLGLLAEVRPSLRWDEQLTRRALDLLPDDGRADLVVLAGCALGADAEDLTGWLDRLEYGARDRDVVVAAATRAEALARTLETAAAPSAIARAARGAPPEAVALAGALGPADAAASWLGELRDVRLAIDGDDLLGAGVPAGPAVGAALAAALAARLDGELAEGASAELEAALRASDVPARSGEAPGQ